MAEHQNKKTAAESERELGRFIPRHYHYQMLLDEARMHGFREALRLVVPVGGRVLELGTGTGVLSFFAAEAGAEQVWCVERQPELAEHARRLLGENGVADRVAVITGDAFEYLPPEPVDVVVCEMLHSALLRESQAEMIAAFCERYTERFGSKLPLFVPQATLLGVEAVEQDFDFFGYRAALPLFEDPANPSPRVRSLSAVTPYRIVDYYGPDLRSPIAWQGQVVAEQAGRCNALRFVTKNVLAIDPDSQAITEWMNQNLILPLDQTGTAVDLAVGQALNVKLAYAPGDEIEVLQNQLQIQD